MSKLEELGPNAAVRGILPDSLVAVVNIEWYGSEVVEFTYKTSSGKVENVLLYRDKESSRDAVRLTIQDHLWSEQTGLPDTYSEKDVRDKIEVVLVHVSRAYPTVPSPCYASMAS